MKRSKVIDIIGVILSVLAVIFLIQRIVVLNVDFTKLITPVNIAMIVIMPFLSVIVIFINSYCWKMHLQLISKKSIETGRSFRAYAQANLMKYLPGNIGHYAGRQLFGTEIGIRQMELIEASIMEIIYSILSIVCCCVLFCLPNIVNKLHYVFLEYDFFKIVIGFCILLLLIIIIFYFMKKNKYVGIFLRCIWSRAFWDTFLTSLLFCSFGTMILAVEYIILFAQYGTLNVEKIFIILSANYISVFIGFVTPGVPGGIGVREAVLMKVLSPFFQEEIVILAAVIHRIVLILSDLLAVPVSWMFILRNKDGGR